MSALISQQPRTTMEILTLPDTPLASLRFDGVTMATLGQIYDSAFAAIGQAVARGLITPVLPGVGIYHGDPMATFDLEVGAVLAQPLDGPIVIGEHRVTPSTLAAGDFAALSHLGSYDGLGESWNSLMSQVAAIGRVPAEPFFEAYLNDPSSTPAEDLRTELMVRLVPTG